MTAELWSKIVINSAWATKFNSSDFLNANFGIPAGRRCLPIPRAKLSTAPDPTNPVYLPASGEHGERAEDNLGVRPRKRNDWVIAPRLDYQPTSRDRLLLTLNVNRFSSPGGVIIDPTVGNYGIQTLANAYVHTSQAIIQGGRTPSLHICSNKFHASARSDQISTPTGLARRPP